MQPVSRAPAPHPSNLPSLEDGQPARERLLYAAGDPAAKAGASPTPAAAGWAAEGAAEDGEDEWQSNDARWGEWASMGGIITSAPAASVDAEGMLHVFCRGITRALTHLRQRWNGTAVAWEAWESLGGALASGPQQRGLSDGSNFINLYVRGSDRAVWRKIEQANVTADPAGRRLGVRWSWLRGGLQWRAEVDFPTEVSMLWGHVASCRLTRPRRSRISCCSPDLRHRLCRTRDLVILDLLWRSGGLKKRGSNWPVVMGGPVWGGRHAAGKADSQAFSGKRLPHRWLGSWRTKPVSYKTWIHSLCRSL